MFQTVAAPVSPAKRALLEEYLRTNVRSAPRVAEFIPRRAEGGIVPLSYAQEQLWLHAQLAPDLPLYNEPVTIHYTGPLNVAAFERSFNEILRRHEAWRTSFSILDGRPVQNVHLHIDISIPIVDLREIPENLREAEAVRIATKDAVTPIDLAHAPLFRARLIRLDDEKHRLYLSLSHIIFDGIAIYRVFLPELAANYKAFATGQPSPLAELPYQYPDFAYWQRNTNRNQKLSIDLEYWRKTLSGDLPVLDLPVDRPRKPVQSFRGSMYPFVVNTELMAGLKELSQKEGVTLFQTLLAGFAVLLQRYSGQDDIPIGTVTSGRDHPGTHKLLGYFLNTLALRLDLSGDLTFRDLLKRARNTTLEALEHDSVPFATLVNELRVSRDASRNPLFQSIFTLEPPMPDVDPCWQLTQMDVDTGATKYDLYLELDERRDGILARFHYSTDLFDRPTIIRMSEEWLTLLRGAVVTPESAIHALPVLPETERRQLLSEWNVTEQPYPQTTIHELFELQARRSPDAVAIEFGDQRLTYSELDARSNQLARHLKTRGAGPDVLVALCIERSLDMVVGLLGVLKARSAYIPLDPAYPDERLHFILSDARPAIVVIQEPLRHRLPNLTEVVMLDADSTAISEHSATSLGDAAAPDNLAYVIYTSGTTGKPKGVEVEHRSVVNFLASMQREPGICAKDVLVAVTTISFDIAGLEIYLPLVTGARVVLASAETSRDGFRLQELLRHSGATMMQATPATWRLLLESGWQRSARLKVLCGGEELTPELANELVRRSASVWNLYGPTETTIWSMAYRIFQETRGLIPLGSPLGNTRVYILDRQLNPVPIGVSGEVHIGGDGVARGYLNRPELTLERFVPDPFAQSPGARLYKTGDLARYLRNGNIEFLGRVDTQVKIRGFRVELGEIEATLEKHPLVRSAVVSIRELSGGDSRLVAYIIPAGHRVPQADSIREFLRVKLPEYMLPAHLVSLLKFPMTPNGKVNRKALPDPPMTGYGAAVSVAPRNETETRLAAIWETVLGVSSIGVNDDFFALGGHSLLAVRLFAGIEKTFGKSIPLATLLNAPTIAQLAEILRSEERPTRGRALVPLQTFGTLPPLYCVHGHYGEILFYRPLSRHMGDQQPFYALQAVASVDGWPAHHTIEDMAEHYLAELRQAQPHGPYYIAGYCFGSLVAFEMAQRLQMAGERVAFLGLFMGYDTSSYSLAQLRSRMRSHLQQLDRDGWKPKLADLATNAALKAKSLLWRRTYRFIGNILPPSSRLFRNVPEMHLQAAKRYAAKRYPGQITVFLSGEVPAGYTLNPDTDLRGLRAKQIELRLVPGVRDTMLQDPHVRDLAQHLQECLANARNDS